MAGEVPGPTLAESMSIGLVSVCEETVVGAVSSDSATLLAGLPQGVLSVLLLPPPASMATLALVVRGGAEAKEEEPPEKPSREPRKLARRSCCCCWVGRGLGVMGEKLPLRVDDRDRPVWGFDWGSTRPSSAMVADRSEFGVV